MFRTKRLIPSRSFYFVPTNSLHITASRGTSTYRNPSTLFYTVTSRSHKTLVHLFSHSSMLRTKRPKPSRSIPIVLAQSLILLYGDEPARTEIFPLRFILWPPVTLNFGSLIQTFQYGPDEAAEAETFIPYCTASFTPSYHIEMYQHVPKSFDLVLYVDLTFR